MNIEVLSFKPSDGDKTRGYVTLTWNELEMHLRVRQYRNENIYIEMPKITMGNKSYHPFRWSSTEKSKEFQKAVLDQMKAKWPDELDLKNVVDKNK